MRTDPAATPLSVRGGDENFAIGALVNADIELTHLRRFRIDPPPAESQPLGVSAPLTSPRSGGGPANTPARFFSRRR